MDQVKIVDMTPLREGKPSPDTDRAIFNALREDFFVGIKGYNPEFDTLGEKLRQLWGEMTQQPELFQRYDGKLTFYQRGTRAGMVRPGEAEIQDPFRIQVMIGPYLEPDHPLNAYHPFQAHLPTAPIP